MINNNEQKRLTDKNEEVLRITDKNEETLKRLHELSKKNKELIDRLNRYVDLLSKKKNVSNKEAEKVMELVKMLSDEKLNYFEEENIRKSKTR